jgi:hypothetical protein
MRSLAISSKFNSVSFLPLLFVFVVPNRFLFPKPFAVKVVFFSLQVNNNNNKQRNEKKNVQSFGDEQTNKPLFLVAANGAHTK